MAKRALTPLPKTVRETVDFIYEYLVEHPDGVTIKMTELLDSRTQKKIISTLIKRGIIQKTAYSVSGKKGCQFKYKWVATMAPTKTLYGSIVSQIRDEDNNWPSHRKNEKPKQSVKESVVVDAPSIVAQETPMEKVDEDKPTWTEWFLIEYNANSGQFHYSKIMKSPKHGFFIYDGIGTYGWMPIAVIPPKADNVGFSLFLSDIDKKKYFVEEIKSIFRDNIKPENLFGENDDLTEVMARIDPDKDIFIEKQKDEPTSVFTGFGPFDGFSEQELWDELKKRGCYIEDNHLVIIKKTYLN